MQSKEQPGYEAFPVLMEGTGCCTSKDEGLKINIFSPKISNENKLKYLSVFHSCISIFVSF